MLRPDAVAMLPLVCQLETCCMLRQATVTLDSGIGWMVHPTTMTDLQYSTSSLICLTQDCYKVLCSGYCEEQEWIDLATVKGYRRTVMCQEVRDELILNLTEDPASEEEEDEDKMQDWQRVVIAMCEGRLLPTPWLNKVMLHSSSTPPPPILHQRGCLIQHNEPGHSID